MDHLPAFDNASEPWSVPYYGGLYVSATMKRFYFQSDFMTDFSDEKFFRLLGEIPPLAVTQILLYFGPIKEILEIEDPVECFTRQDAQGGRWIDSSSLPELCRLYLANREKEDQEQIRKLVEESNTILTFVGSVAGELSMDTSAATSRLHLSIALLLECLSCLQRQNRSTVPKSGWCGVSQEIEALGRELINQGWCPALKRKLWHNGNNSALYLLYLSGYAPTVPSHSLCHDRYCTAYNNLDASEAKHSDQCDALQNSAKCVLVGPDIGRLTAIIEDGGIPLIHLDVSKELIEVKIMQYKPPMLYIAISHVMMQGLGNMSANALYSCRLRTIAEHVHETYATEGICPQHELFWLDSLCVPTKAGPARRIAVGTMDTVYRNAGAVLAIDSTLVASSMRNRFQAAFNIWISPWSTRLWCLTEFVLAPSLRIKFKDGVESFGDLTEYLQSFCDNVRCCAAVYDNLNHGFLMWRILKRQDVDYLSETCQNPYGTLLLAIAGRVISKPVDEAFCLSLFLKLPRDKILDCAKGQEMVRFWSLQDEVPEEVLFSRTPNLDVEGYRWAPKSVLDWSAQRSMVLGPLAKRNEEGLLVTLKGYFLDPIRLWRNKDYFFRAAGRTYLLLKLDWLTLPREAAYIPSPVVIVPNDYDGAHPRNQDYVALASSPSPSPSSSQPCHRQTTSTGAPPPPVKVALIGVFMIVPIDFRLNAAVTVAEATPTPGAIPWIVS